MRGTRVALLSALLGTLALPVTGVRAQAGLDALLSSATFPASHAVTVTLLPPAPRKLIPLLSGVAFPATHNATLTLTPPPSLDQALAGAQFPVPGSVTLTLTPPIAQALAGGQFPATHDVTLTLLPPAPRRLEPLLTGAQFPATQNVTLTLAPPPSLDVALAGAQFPVPRNVTLTLAQPPATAPAPTAGDSVSLAPVASANFPAPQALSVVLVPPPSPYAAIAGANFPAPQALSVVLVPPPSPYAAVAGANFPAPQALSVVLVPGAAMQVTTAMGTAKVPQLRTGGNYSVQIVQVIPRNGANFFDRNDPTGQATIDVAPAAPAAPVAGPPAPPPPPSPPVEVCNTGPGFTDPIFTDGHGNPSLVAPPNPGLRIDFIPGFRVFVAIAPGSTWDSFTGAPFFPVGGGFTLSPAYAIGCPANAGTNGFSIRIRASFAGPVCVQRNSLGAINCDAQGN